MNTQERPTVDPISNSDEVLSSRNGNFYGKSNSSIIAERLIRPADHNELLREFRSGDTEVRDVARFTLNERTAVMNLGRLMFQQDTLASQSQTSDQYRADSCIKANENFRDAIEDRSGHVQANAGWNFTVNATRFFDADLPWARQLDHALDSYMRTLSNGRTHGGLRRLTDGRIGDGDIRKIWSEFSRRDPISMAWYLSERSQYSENYQTELHQGSLVEAKRGASSLINEFASQYNLPAAHLNRAQLQLHEAKFSAYDHLIGGIDAGDGTLGDYQTMTLRVETKAGGSISRPAPTNDPIGVTSHELFHASSTQSKDVSGMYRVGLRAGDQGLDANEGMTELLNKLSLGRVTPTDAGRYQFHDVDRGRPVKDAAYPSQVRSMFILMKNDPPAFATLFRAYYGDVLDVQRVADALEKFNHNMSHM